MSLDISLKLADVSDISTGRLLSGFEDESGKLNDGRIKSNGHIYEVKFLEGGTAEVRRNYQGPFSWFRNRWSSHETTRAKALQEKIKDDAERNKALGKFMSSSNWLLPKEQESFNKLAQQIGLENATRRADETAVTQRKAYNLFRNVISYAFFRQTSKLGLEFFRNKGTPVSARPTARPLRTPRCAAP